jgi:hypothetical protein
MNPSSLEFLSLFQLGILELYKECHCWWNWKGNCTKCSALVKMTEGVFCATFANPKAVGLHVGKHGMPIATSAWVKESSQSRGSRTRRATSGKSTRRVYTVLIMEFEEITRQSSFNVSTAG